MINKQTNKSITYIEALKKLTPREIDVLDLVEKGHTNKEIATQLHLSYETVKTHRKNMCKKLGVKGGNGLLKWIWRVRNNTS